MKKMTQKFESGFENLGRWIHAHPKRVILVMLLFFASLASNIPSIEVDTSTESFFSKKEWIWLFNRHKYNGNYEFIYF